MSISDEQKDFWDEIILDDDGNVDLEAVYNELADFYFVAQQAARVYYDITCGQLTRPNYHATDVLQVAEECADKLTQQEVLRVLIAIDSGDITMEEALAEHSAFLDDEPDVQT